MCDSGETHPVDFYDVAASLTNKPLLLSEWGMDTFDNDADAPFEEACAEHLAAQWQALISQVGSGGISIGGAVFEVPTVLARRLSCHCWPLRSPCSLAHHPLLTTTLLTTLLTNSLRHAPRSSQWMDEPWKTSKELPGGSACLPDRGGLWLGWGPNAFPDRCGNEAFFGLTELLANNTLRLKPGYTALQQAWLGNATTDDVDGESTKPPPLPQPPVGPGEALAGTEGGDALGQSDAEGWSAILIVALSVGGVVVFLLLLGAVSHFWRHREERRHASKRARGTKAQPVRLRVAHPQAAESSTVGDEVPVADLRPSQPAPLPPVAA